MFGILILVLVSPQTFVRSASVADPAADTEDAPRCVACVNTSGRLHAPKSSLDGDLDPANCSTCCLNRGYQAAALTSRRCYCGNWQYDLVASKPCGDVRGERRRANTHTFVVEVSAGCQPADIHDLGEQDCTYVTFEIQEMTDKGQRSRSVNVTCDSFSVAYVNASCSPSTLSSAPPCTGCPANSDCPNSTAVLVCVNAFDLKAKGSGSQPTPGDEVSVHLGHDVELFDLALNAENSSCLTGEEAIAVFIFNHTETVVVQLQAKNCVHTQNKSQRLHVERNRKSLPQVRVNPTWQPPSCCSPAHSPADNVLIYTAKQAYPTNTEVSFWAVVKENSSPVEFLWDFGDSTSARTTSRTITKRYGKPGRYDVVVVMSKDGTSLSSDVFILLIQRPVKLNRLLHQASVLLNRTVTLHCRVRSGTNVSVHWSFGDGSSRLGLSTEQHVFLKTGEFRVTVTVSNLVSSASLSSHIFVVNQPCQPPPVKNMGPLKLQVRRYEGVRLGVSYESEFDCNSSGLLYNWTLFDSTGRVFPLPLVDTRRQTLILPSKLLDYDTYTAIARIQVIDSVVYSNYSMRVQVIPSPPVASIQGGTNIFINMRNTTVVFLDGQTSYDPDFPMNPLSFRWTCNPVSSIPSSCFHQHVPTSSPVLVFPVSFLKHNFDQFRFVLTVRSGERSASSETFVTLTSNVIRTVSLLCPQCLGDHINGERSFTVTAVCDACDISPQYVQYTWSLYSVNASSKPVKEVPFCYRVDHSGTGPSAIMEATDSSTLHLLVTQASQNTTVSNSPTDSLIESDSETGDKNISVPNDQTLAKKERKQLSPAARSREEPFSHPLGEIDPLEPEYQPLARDNSGVFYSDHFGQSDIISRLSIDPDSSADWELSFPVSESSELGGHPDLDFDVYLSAEEGEPGLSAGRPTGGDGEFFSSGEDPVPDPELHEDQGSNLMDSSPSVVIKEPVLLELSRELVDVATFESYTYTGLSSSLVTFRPFSLSPGSTYMLEATAKSPESFLGRTQLFLKTNPMPKGMTCQVQPAEGTELVTHFGIFCTSGKEDFTYKYSLRVGERPPRTLYEGTDFQYYFSLPAGDPTDHYKVTIYTEIRSSLYGTSTKPCPVSVRVQPISRDTVFSHLDLDLELSTSGLKNLSALLQLGNSAEVRNYVSLLTGMLNRLSLDSSGNIHAQRRTRNVLLCTMCELENSDQTSMEDSNDILQTLLQVTGQVALASARQVTHHIQAISQHFSKSSSTVWFSLDQKTLHTLITLLSHVLQAAITNDDFAPTTFNANVGASETEENIRNATLAADGCELKASSAAISMWQVVYLVADILKTASDLMLKHILFHEVQDHQVSTGLVALYAARQNHTSTVIRGGSVTFYMPASLIQFLFVHHRAGQPCVIAMVTELTHSPYTWASYTEKLSGPVVGLSLYECDRRRKIPVRSLIQPITVELQQQPANSCAHHYTLSRRQVSYHSFNITEEHLQQAVQLSVDFKQPINKAFPIVMLFRMFERPTPSMHHLSRTHRWERNSFIFTLPSLYLRAAGVGHLALLDADFGKSPRHKHVSEQVSYSIRVDSRLCLSWDDHQGAWTHSSCRTLQADATTAVNCSCRQLRPLTVVQQQIHNSHDTSDLDLFLSTSSNLTVLGVLVLCVCLYIPGWVACKRADVISEVNQRVHHLSDNSPHDPYLYAVTVHTGPCSAASMSAKVYIVLQGEDGVSQTKELQAPGCTLFRRNSQDTFIVSAADSLGAVWGVQIWHDNSGPSPSWYLKQLEVSEMSRGPVEGRSWLFMGQCWLAVNKDDGQVERTLQACAKGIGFAKMLCLKLSDYLADYHIWISVHSCPHPNSFTHTQRLSVSLLLLLGYATVNTSIISQMDDWSPFDLGIIDASAISVAIGVLSVLPVLPVVAVITSLFRLREVKFIGSEAQQIKGGKTEKDCFEVIDSSPEPPLFWIQLWSHEVWRKKYLVTPQGSELLTASGMTMEAKSTDKEVVRSHSDNHTRLTLLPEGRDYQEPLGKTSESLSESNRFHGTQRVNPENTDPKGKLKRNIHYQSHSSGGKGLRPVSHWCHYLAWTLCLLLSLSCLVFSAVVGTRFSSSKALLWMHAFFFSLISCFFLIQPVMIMTVAVILSFWYRKRVDFHSFSIIKECLELSVSDPPKETSYFAQDGRSYLEKLLRVRQRARYLRLVRPPAPAELRKTRRERRREALLLKTVRDLFFYGCMLFLMLCINHNSSYADHYHLKNAITKQYISRGRNSAFMSIQKQEDWWKWAQTSLLNLLYKNASDAAELHILVGEPVLWKMEVSSSFHSQVSSATVLSETLRLFLSGNRTSPHPQLSPIAKSARMCGQLGCYIGPITTMNLGHTKSDAVSKLKVLCSGRFWERRTVVLKIKFTLFSPAPNLFTTVTMLTEHNPTGVLQSSVEVQSVRVYRSPAVWDYVIMVYQLLFLVFSLLQLCDQVQTLGQQGIVGYWRTPCNWLEASLLSVTLVYYIYYIHHSVIILEVVDLLQRHDHVDVSHLATCEQHIRALRGVTLFLLFLKCVTVLRVNRTMATSAALFSHSLSNLFWPMISGLILMAALSHIGNLLFSQSSKSFSTLSNSIQTLLCHHCGPKTVTGLHSSWSAFILHRVLCLACTVLFTAVVIGAVSSSVTSARRSQSRGNVFTVGQLVSYIRQRVTDFPGKHRKLWSENRKEEKTYYFEEFESLLDELLFRLNALSNSLHHMLPPKAHHYREDSPIISPVPPNMDTQEFVRTQMTEERFGEITPASHLPQSKPELEVPPFLQQRAHSGDISFSGFFVAVDNTRQYKRRGGGNSKNKELQANFKQAGQWANPNDSCCLSKHQAAHTEVVVEVLVHKDPV